MTRHSTCLPAEHTLHRRNFLGGLLASGAAASLSIPGVSLAGGLPVGEALKQQNKRALFIWLAGGASQFEMWDPKPGRETGGPFRAIQTAVAGYHVCELMPKLATRMNKLAVVRSLNTQISEHFQAADLISTGWPKEAALEHPEIGVILAKELALQDSLLPDYVSLFATTEGRRRPETGFLSRRHGAALARRFTAAQEYRATRRAHRRAARGT